MRGGAIGLAAFVVAVVAMMIVPLPTPLLDLLLTSNLAISVALLLVAVWSARTLELSTFPTLLLLTTLYRLALNVSSVRLILLQANAGRVIHAFGAFVVRGDYVFASTGYGTGAVLLKLERSADGVDAKEVYFLNAPTFQNPVRPG